MYHMASQFLTTRLKMSKRREGVCVFHYSLYMFRSQVVYFLNTVDMWTEGTQTNTRAVVCSGLWLHQHRLLNVITVNSNPHRDSLTVKRWERWRKTHLFASRCSLDWALPGLFIATSLFLWLSEASCGGDWDDIMAAGTWDQLFKLWNPVLIIFHILLEKHF